MDETRWIWDEDEATALPLQYYLNKYFIEGPFPEQWIVLDEQGALHAGKNGAVPMFQETEVAIHYAKLVEEYPGALELNTAWIDALLTRDDLPANKLIFDIDPGAHPAKQDCMCIRICQVKHHNPQ